MIAKINEELAAFEVLAEKNAARNARPRSVGGKASVTMATPKAIIMAAPTACSTRNAISQ